MGKQINLMLNLRFSSSHKNHFDLLITVSCAFTRFTAKYQVVPEAKNTFYHFKGQFLGIRGQEVMDTKALSE